MSKIFLKIVKLFFIFEIILIPLNSFPCPFANMTDLSIALRNTTERESLGLSDDFTGPSLNPSDLESYFELESDTSPESESQFEGDTILVEGLGESPEFIEGMDLMFDFYIRRQAFIDKEIEESIRSDQEKEIEEKKIKAIEKEFELEDNKETKKKKRKIKSKKKKCKEKVRTEEEYRKKFGYVLIHKAAYSVVYSLKYRLPELTLYELDLSKKIIDGNIPKLSRLKTFSSEASLAEEDRTYHNDFKHSNIVVLDKKIENKKKRKIIYDFDVSRGHSVPAHDLCHNNMLFEETFNMINVFPQEASFNSKVWKELENAIFEQSFHGRRLLIFTGVASKDSNNTKLVYRKNGKEKNYFEKKKKLGRILRSNIKISNSAKEFLNHRVISIPEKVYKIVIDVTEKPYKSLVFLMDNNNSYGPKEIKINDQIVLNEKWDLSKYLVRIEEISKLTKFDFNNILVKMNILPSRQNNLSLWSNFK